MTKNVLYYSATTLDDFKKRLGLAYVEGGVAPADNQWSFIEAEHAARIKSAAGTGGFLKFNLGYLFVGDVIDVEAEFLNITGEKGQIGIDKVTESGSFISSFIISSTNGDNYESLKNNYLITSDGYYAVTFGVHTNDVGEFKLRKPRVKVNSVKQHSRGDSVVSTLLNGWTGEVKCKKNEFGVTTVSAKIKPGTTEATTKITTLPVGYRPPTNGVVQTMDDWGGVGGLFRFQANGDIIVPSGVTLNETLNHQFFITYLTD